MVRKEKKAIAEEAKPVEMGPLLEQMFCPVDDPFSTVEWVQRQVTIEDKEGNVIFDRLVEAPSSWSEQSVQIVASRYFYGTQDDETVEHSIKELIHRVARTIADWAKDDGYLDDADTEMFYRELAWLCLHQYGAFNSPVWFNCGLNQTYGLHDRKKTAYVYDKSKGSVVKASDTLLNPQCSACFIVSVDDTMESIMELATTEAMLFKYGSGAGTNNSTLRSSHERLSGTNNHSSGPLSFMRIRDQVAAVVKSGGKTRRAAKMELLNIDHPDIMEFIDAKPAEERKAWALIQAGYSEGMNGEAYGTVLYQNSNFSVRIPDRFMRAYEEDAEWETKAVRTRDVVQTYKARDVMREVAQACHMCGDPGVQFRDTFNRWHTCKATGPINATNPCSEFAFLDDSACNLASLNLKRFVDEFGCFNIEKFQRAVDVFVLAQEVIIDRASYPTRRIAETSHKFRPLGLGFANLGALLMTFGLPYDSDLGREFSAAVTSLMTARAYNMSARLAAKVGAFEGWTENAREMMDVIIMHSKQNTAHVRGKEKTGFETIFKVAGDLWRENRKATSFRNAQVTLLAPTGTISFMMDCDTTGIEPDFALVKYKTIANGGTMKMVNNSVAPALKNLGYTETQIQAVYEYLRQEETLKGCPVLKEEHMPVFACASGDDAINYMGHLKMMGAVQPFLSGSISKTVNLPESVTVEEIENVYVEAWKMDLKSVALFRDGCKASPLSDGGFRGIERPVPKRYKLPDTCKSVRHKFEINGHEGYINVGMYDDGTPGELFTTMSKQGSTISGLMDTFSIAVSLLLQHGVPLEYLVDKFAFTRFEPSGWTPNQDIPNARSPVDYIFRWMSQFFLNQARENANGIKTDLSGVENNFETKDDGTKHVSEDVVCKKCGHTPMTRTGSCYTCPSCGETSGCS